MHKARPTREDLQIGGYLLSRITISGGVRGEGEPRSRPGVNLQGMFVPERIATTMREAHGRSEPTS